MAAGPRYGWTYREGKLVEDPQEQEVIAEICRLRDKERLSYGAIAGRLNREGFLMRGRDWQSGQVRHVYQWNTSPDQRVADVRHEDKGEDEDARQAG